MSRYYLPVYPLLLACAAVACSVAARGLKSLIVIFLVLSVITVDARSLFVPPAPPDWVLTRAMMAEDVQPGMPVLQWLRQRVGPDGSVVAVEGQAVHYLLQRPAVAVISAGFSNRRLDGQNFRSLMLQFRSRYLVLFPNAPQDRIPEQDSNDFLRSFTAGHSPAWLKPAVRTRDTLIYECAGCGN